MPISIVLVDDHAVVRDGLRVLLELEPDFHVAAAFGDAAAAVRYCTESNPDVALLDVAMPGLSGIEAARQIHDLCADTRILMLSMHVNRQYLFESLQAGAAGFVPKDSAFSELLTAIHSVVTSGTYLSPPLASTSMANARMYRHDHS